MRVRVSCRCCVFILLSVILAPPGVFGQQVGTSAVPERFDQLFRQAQAGMSAAQLQKNQPRINPVDRLSALARNNVPILHLHGDADKVVSLQQNTIELVSRYQALGGSERLEGNSVCNRNACSFLQRLRLPFELSRQPSCCPRPGHCKCRRRNSKVSTPWIACGPFHHSMAVSATVPLCIKAPHDQPHLSTVPRLQVTLHQTREIPK